MILKGVSINNGQALAEALIIEEFTIGDFTNTHIAKDEVEKNLFIAKKAVQDTIKDFESLCGEYSSNAKNQEKEILSAHLMMAKDSVLHGKIVDNISNKFLCAEGAIELAINDLAKQFEELKNEYFKERAQDVKDIGQNILMNLKSFKVQDLSVLPHPVILIAKEISPSILMSADKSKIKGIVSETGGKTSHIALLAKGYGVAAVLGCKGAVEAAGNLKDGELVAIDGKNNLVDFGINPKKASEFLGSIENLRKKNEALRKWAGVKTQTIDKSEVLLCANIADPSEIENAQDSGTDGIGLFRTEFMFMNREEAPSENEQFEIYKKTAQDIRGKHVVIRTLDIGGDKQIGYLGIIKEENPFLGSRGIRVSLEKTKLFSIQIKSILRASIYGNIAMMFPMISNMDELDKAMTVVGKVKADLAKDGISYDSQMKIGMMIEIPSAAMMADEFIKKVDFFSIGSNDLAQYMMAADRLNAKVSHLCDYFNPGFLRSIKNTVQSVKAYPGKWVGICGEMAGDPRAVPLLLGMGIDELSVCNSSLLIIKRLINSFYMSQAEEIADQALKQSNSNDIKRLLEDNMPEWALSYIN